MSLSENEDIRMFHISISAQQVLAFNTNEWKEMILKEENQSLIKDFLDTPTTNLLLIYFDITEKLTLSLEVLNDRLPLPKRLCFFLKNCKTVSLDNYKQEIVFGNLCDFPFNQYQDLFGKVIVPIFCNASNNQRWPIETGCDIANHIQDFQTTLSYHIGLAEQKPLLLVPDTAKLIDNYNVNEFNQSDYYDQGIQNIVNSITEMLSNWIPIVREILELTTEHILSQVDQGPTTEISFWNERKENLEFIYAQVDSPLVKKMVLALEKSNNTHLSDFKMLLQDIAEGLDEAREVSGNFIEMSEDLEEISGCSFHKLKDLLPEALITITSSWIQSKYYKSIPSRIIVLVQKICYILFEKTYKFLDPLSLFTGNRDEATKNVKLSLDVMYLFLKSYKDCREKFQLSDEENHIYPWEFPDERVFTQFKIFIQRLKEILDIFLVAEAYYNIPIKKLFKVQQVEYRRRIQEIQLKFTEAYTIFEKCTYDPLDLKSMEFSKDYNSFSKKVQELDIKFGITIGHVCLLFNSVEDTSEVINVFEEMIKRPLVNQEFQKLVSSHILYISTDFFHIKNNYTNLMRHLDKEDEIFVYKNLPMISGAIQWCLDLQKKLALSMESLGEVSEYFENAEDRDNILTMHQDILYLLNEFEEYIARKWKSMLHSFHPKVDQELLKIDDKNCVSINFHSQISEVIQDIHYLKEIKKDNFLPEEAKKFNDISGNVLQSQSLLACAIRWYNDLNESRFEIERKLVSEDWDKITSLIKKGYTKKWTDNDVLTYADELYSITKRVYEIVNEAKQNVSVVEKFIQTWNSEPMIIREHPDSLVDFETDNAPKVLKQISAVKLTSENMRNVLEKNKELLKSDASSEEWKSYVSYLDSIIENGIKDAIKCSLEYLHQNVDSSNIKLAPFCEVCMWLDQDAVFTPPLQPDDSKSLCLLFEEVIIKIYSLATVINRLTNDNLDYYDAIYHSEELEAIKNLIQNNILSGCNEALSASEVFKLYSDLWLISIEEELADFVQHGPMQDAPKEEGVAEEMQTESNPPTEEDFKFQIMQFDKLHRKVDDIPQVIRVEPWLILNVSSFKDSLLLIIRKWSSAYKNKLVELKSLGKLRKLENEDP